MKRLIVLRHGKAEQPSFDQRDFDRGLTARGKRDSERVGEVLVEHGYIPEQVITSTAKRARSTAKRASRAFDLETERVETEELYLSGVHDILGIVRAISESTTTAMIVGHNPGFGTLVDRMAGPIDDFPTAAFGVLELEVEFWAEIEVDSRARLEMHWWPKSESGG